MSEVRKTKKDFSLVLVEGFYKNIWITKFKYEKFIKKTCKDCLIKEICNNKCEKFLKKIDKLSPKNYSYGKNKNDEYVGC